VGDRGLITVYKKYLY